MLLIVMNKWLWLSLVAIIVAGGFLILKNYSFTTTPNYQPKAPETATPSPSPTSASPSAAVSEKNLVMITASGFEPKVITIKAGEAVTWKNTDSLNHTVDSAPHPTHTSYPPLNLGLIAPGTSKSLVFPTPGTYKYHDHLNPSLTGQVVVQ